MKKGSLIALSVAGSFVFGGILVGLDLQSYRDSTTVITTVEVCAQPIRDGFTSIVNITPNGIYEAQTQSPFWGRRPVITSMKRIGDNPDCITS